MKSKGAFWPLALLVLLEMMACATAVSAQTTPVPKLNSEQRKRVQALSTLVDEVMAQKHSAPADVVLAWHGLYVASDNGLVYVPYTIDIDGKLVGMPVAMYVRVLTKDALPASFDPSKTTTMRSYLGQMSVVVDTKDIRSGHVDATGIVTEDVHFFEPPKDGRLNRGFWVPPGEYNVYIAMQEKAGKGFPKTAVLKQSITVPNLLDRLSLSSVILASSLEPAPPTSRKQAQLDDPYTIAGTRIVPAPSSRLPRSGELTAVYFISNGAGGSPGPPDLTAEYVFYQRVGTGAVVFRQSPSQRFNAETLPPAFDASARQQIMGGLAVPLATFPVGDYRLEVKVTDNTSRSSVTEALDFSVTGP